jgi:hypothetical protein
MVAMVQAVRMASFSDLTPAVVGSVDSYRRVGLRRTLAARMTLRSWMVWVWPVAGMRQRSGCALKCEPLQKGMHSGMY